SACSCTPGGKIRDRTAAFTTFQCCQNANFTSIGQIKGKSGNGVCDFSQNSSFAKLSMLQMTVVNAPLGRDCAMQITLVTCTHEFAGQFGPPCPLALSSNISPVCLVSRSESPKLNLGATNGAYFQCFQIQARCGRRADGA
ncbi:hypothetical protein MCOR16_006931, partial [Pyricularia oryzae]